MEKIKTLTVGTDTYQLCDPEAARIDDAAVGENVWSSQAIVDRFCPEFTASGETATCTPVAGSTLSVTGQIALMQSGSGIPAPDNICPIAATDILVLTVQNGQTVAEYITPVGQTVCSGTYDWQTGQLVLDRRMVTFTGLEKFTSNANEVGYELKPVAKDDINAVQSACSHYPAIDRWTGYKNAATPGFQGVSANASNIRFIDNVSYPGGDAVGIAAYFRQQYEAGTPVQVAYLLKEPLQLQLDPSRIVALPGTNTVHCNLGAVTVNGRSDLCELLKAHGIQ